MHNKCACYDAFGLIFEHLLISYSWCMNTRRCALIYSELSTSYQQTTKEQGYVTIKYRSLYSFNNVQAITYTLMTK